MTNQAPNQIRPSVNPLALLNAPVPRIYANGFALAMTPADISIITIVNGNASGILSMSHTAAKGLMAELSTSLAKIEAALGTSVLTIQEMDDRLQNQFGQTS